MASIADEIPDLYLVFCELVLKLVLNFSFGLPPKGLGRRFKE